MADYIEWICMIGQAVRKSENLSSQAKIDAVRSVN